MKLVVVRLSFAPCNEKLCKRLMSQLEFFTNFKVKFNIIWNARKIKSLFSNQDKLQLLGCVIDKGVCSWGAVHFVEIIPRDK